MSIGTFARSMLRPFVSLAGLLAVTLVLVTCSENVAPHGPYAGVLVIAPHVTVAEASVVVSEVHINLVRLADGSVAKDTTVVLTPGDSTVEITLALALNDIEEQFELTMVLVDPAGGTAFTAGPTIVTASTGTDPLPVPIELIYAGVGADAAGVFILSPDTLITEGDEIKLEAVVLDSTETPIPGTPIVWLSLDTARARIPFADSARVVGAAQRGVARIVAQLLTGHADTMQLTAQPAPATLSLESGDGQTAFADSQLELPLVTHIVAADELGVEAVWVRYVVTQGGGTLSADSLLSDSDGLTSVTWRLGAAGAQQVRASSPALPSATVTFTATATEPPQEIGPQIAFFSDSGGSSGLYRVNGDGSGLTLIEQVNGDYPQWSPARERVVFALFRDWIRVAAADASGSADLTTSLISARPRFNSNGQRLAYSCAPSIYDWPEICVVPDVSGPLASLVGIAEGGGTVFVMDSIAPDATGPGTFAWDPLDPDRLVFFRDSLDEVTSNILTWLYASRYDGSALELLTPGFLEYQGTPLGVSGTIDWSPDGQQIVFTGYGALYLINRDGTGLTRLTLGSAAGNQENDYDPRFSPDGQQIAFVRRITYFNGQAATDVWAINTDGTNVHQLTTDQHSYTETRVTVDWSPDGTELVVVGAVAPPNDYSVAVYVIPASSSPDTYMSVRRRIGRVGDVGAISERHPVWRP